MTPHPMAPDRVAALVDDAGPLAAITRACEQWGCEPSGPWQRGYARRTGRLGGYATILFERAAGSPRLVRVDAYPRPLPAPAGTVVVDAGAAGLLHVSALPSSEELPTLAELLEQTGGEIFRYAPGGRCTLRVVEDGSTRYVKVFTDERGARLHTAGLALWRAASTADIGFDVVRPLRYDEPMRAWWLQEMPGSPAGAAWQQPGAVALAERVGAAASTLARVPARPDKLRDAAAQMAISDRRGQRMAALRPELADAIESLLARLRALLPAIADGELGPVHADMTPMHWIDDGTRLGLIDLDDLCLGHPELDTANLLTEIALEECPQERIDTLVPALLRGWQQGAGHVDIDRVRWYLGHMGLRKAAKSSVTLKRNSERRAGRRVAMAHEWLDGGLV